MSFILKVLFKTVFETQLCSSYPVPGAELMFEECKNKVKRLLQEPETEGNQKRPRSVSSSLSLLQVQSAKKPQESQTKQDWRERVLLGTDKNGSTITGRTIAKAATISWNLEECRNAGDPVSMEVDNQLQVQERNEEEDAKMIEKLKATGVFGVINVLEVKAMASRCLDQDPLDHSGAVGYLACAQRETLLLALQMTSGLASPGRGG